MSQRITVKSIVTKPTKKEGTNITTIEDEKGAKMSAFNDTALAQLHAGDILEVELAVEGKYTNITAWKLIESKPAPPAPAPIPVPPPTDWAEKDRITRVSIERQVALKCAVEARPGQTDQIIVASAAAFYQFLSGQPAKEALFPALVTPTATPPSSQPPAAQTGAVAGKHPARAAALPDSVASVDAAQKIAEQCGMNKDTFLQVLGDNGLSLKSTQEQVWKLIKPLLG